ncbi:unnamed protein product [Caenorhabditis angaria]|uniref:DEP domain-containing protein n=1 Tax=Caenorhabditis angaria TaxID=860376 RepID=A0A9P1ISE7_9PELO|nr:unnamed protein product [Caenorhabditis angaria]
MSSDGFAGQVVIYTEVGNSKCAKGRELLSQERIPYTDVSLDSFPQHAQEIFDRTGTDVLPQIFFNNIYIGHDTDLDQLINEKMKWEAIIEMVRREKCRHGPIVPNPMNAIGYDENEDVENNNKKEEMTIWVPDEYAKLVRDMKAAQLIKNNRVSFRTTYKNSFKGEQLIEWLMKEKSIKRSEALEIGQELIDRHVGQQTSKESGMTFSPDRYYQLVEDDENKPLNAKSSDDENPEKMSVEECNNTLIKLLKPIYEKILSDDNTSIIYQKLTNNDEFNRYLQFSKELNNLDLNNSSADDRLTFFINIYNIILIHIIYKFGQPQSIWQRRKLVNGTYYLLGGHRYALHSIINGILRANRKGPGMLWKAFGKQDGRLNLSLANCDPLIHFGLCTGSRTTPLLRLYNTKTIYQELRLNAKQTLLRGDKYLRIDTKKNIIHLGKTFKWYSEDFGGTTEKILQWILDIISDDESDKKHNLQKLFFTGDYSVEYIAYDWSTNSKEFNSVGTISENRESSSVDEK